MVFVLHNEILNTQSEIFSLSQERVKVEIGGVVN